MGEPQATPPRVIAGRYELDALIGKGGFAEVWRARHLALNSFVAIKFLQVASAQNETTRKRFTTEAQVTAQLKSQHAVQVFDFGVTDDGQPYLVMELLEGETLGRRIERAGRLGIVETARLVGQSARALHRAHQLGIVHRDFKPDNIVISADDEGRDYVKVLDFGIAKIVGDLEPSSAPTVLDPSSAAPPSTFTKTGSILGTPYYMAPEQVRNASEVDLRSDIWALGIVTFECLTGSTPFVGATLLELFERIRNGRHPPAHTLEPNVPPTFNDWFDIACAPEASRRFPDAQTAWKRLLVALECGRIEIEPSIRRSLSASGETASFRLAGDGADGTAKTMDALPRGVEPRRHNRLAHTIAADAPARLSLEVTAEEAPPTSAVERREEPVAAVPVAPAPPRSVAPRASIDTTVRTSRKPPPRLPLVGALLVAAGAVAWWALARPAAPPSPAATEPAPAAAAPPAVSPSPSTPATSAPAAPVASSAAEPSATASAAAKPPPQHPRPPAASPRPPPPPAPARPATAASPPAASPPPAPAAPAATVADPSSYR
jgi:serine/threonine-protein kinase